MPENHNNKFRTVNKYFETGIYFGCFLLILLIAFIDLNTPLGIAVSSLYVLVILLSFSSSNVNLIYLTALASTICTIGMYFYKPPIPEMWKVLFNRSISLFIIMIATFYGLKAKRAEQQLIEMANYDHLTGLLNRHEMHNRLSVEHSRVNRRGEPLSIILFDIDHFKHINDTYGHMIGDRVLKKIAEKLGENMREYDLIFRFGGEEFLVISPENTVQQALELAERLRRQVAESPLDVDAAPPITLTISAGVTQLRTGESVESMISRADAALYQAKENGRNRVETL